MYMFNMNQRYNQLIIAPIHIKHAHFSVSYHRDPSILCWRGHESPSEYGALGPPPPLNIKGPAW